ncbi:ornithine cyclodeaminase family protein [Micrococcus luteus]|uniref:ornithine cyclodeaminase family protein n=1 Tax=Micrococcus luteus TaxID=1270 RepID=UPI00351823F8
MDTHRATASLPWIDGPAVRAALSPRAAVDALEAALAAGLDPEADAPRTRVATAAGQLLQMPSTRGTEVGTKLLTLTPDNPERGLPVIQGVYVLFGAPGAPGQAPRAVLDGVELTGLRTSAVSALGVRLLADASPRHLVVFGTGVQAWEHALTFQDVFGLEWVSVVGRDADRAAALAARIEAELGVTASAAGPEAVAEADVVVTCTAAMAPLFDGTLVPEHATVVAMGSHTTDARETDDALARRATVAVESRDSAAREAGDVTLAVASGALAGIEDTVTLAELVAGTARRREGAPALFVTTGMPWQDLVVASAVARVVLG